MAVTVRHFLVVADALLAKGRLAQRGIVSEIKDDTARLIELRVHEDDLPETQTLLEDPEMVTEAEQAPAIDSAIPASPTTCESCASTDVVRVHRFRVWFAATAIIGAIGFANAWQEEAFFLIAAISIASVIRPPWRCNACGHRWRV